MSNVSVLSWRLPPGSQESDSSQTAKKDMLAALRARQDALEETLKLRLEELKNICIREAVRPLQTHAPSVSSTHTDLPYTSQALTWQGSLGIAGCRVTARWLVSNSGSF